MAARARADSAKKFNEERSDHARLGHGLGEYGVDDAENRGRGADTERQSKGSHHRRTGFVEQQTKPVADIGYQGLHNAPFRSKRDARRRILANNCEKG